MDLIVKDGTLVNVNTGELYEADVRVSRDRIVAIGKLKNGGTTGMLIIDARDRFILPGLMDTHVHVKSSMLTPTRFC